MRFNKNIAVAKITDPAEVKSWVTNKSGKMHSGAIVVDCPELNLKDLYCRYGLPVPYMRVKKDDKVWIEPTVEDGNCTERWIYTGFADCSGRSSVNPSTEKVLIYELPDGEALIKIGNNEIKINSSGIEIKDKNNNKITESNTGIKIEDGVNTQSVKMDPAGTTLETGDASPWCPNSMVACPFSGATHGGAGAGIVKLKGA